MYSVLNSNKKIKIKSFLTHRCEVGFQSFKFDGFPFCVSRITQSLKHNTQVKFLQIFQVSCGYSHEYMLIQARIKLSRWVYERFKGLAQGVICIAHCSKERIIDIASDITEGYFYPEYLRFTLEDI